MSNKCDMEGDTVGSVHITKDKDVMTVIPKMLMILYFDSPSVDVEVEVEEATGLPSREPSHPCRPSNVVWRIVRVGVVCRLQGCLLDVIV